MERKRDMKKHVTFVGAIHIGFGVLKVIGAVVIFFALNLAHGYIQDVEVATTVINLIKVLLPTLVALGGVLSIIGGIGLFSYQQWARILIIIMSALNCLNIPIGTAKGVYSLWALLQDDTIKLFHQQDASVVKMD